jgi:MFS family permease
MSFFSKSKPYVDLIRNNRDFRLLWISQVISNFGDWFGILAVYAIIQQYSGSEFLLGLIIVVKMLSLAAFSPLAGYITDRFNRRRLMVWCDILRGLIVLGFLFIASYQSLWLAYLLTALQMMMSAIFQPAKTSSIPNVTSPKELVNANILSAASWSVVFTTGMALGGLATSWLGTDLVFVINSASYLYSAWIIWLARVPQKPLSEKEERETRNPLKGIRAGFRYLNDNRHVLRPALAKASMTASSGALVYLLIIVAEDVLLMGSVGLGLLYAARGVGTGIGPVLGRRLFHSESRWVWAMGVFMALCGLFYLPLAATQSLMLMLLFVMIAHMASGATWVMSTVLLQRRSPDAYRGRAFSIEWLLFTLSQSVSVTMASLLLEFGWLSIQQSIALFATALLFTGLLWLIVVAPGESSGGLKADSSHAGALIDPETHLPPGSGEELSSRRISH